MSGVGFSEFLILCLIGLIVLGPQRLPKVASQIGSWVGQARRMTRVMKRQLEEELNFDEDLNIMPSNKVPAYTPPRDDDDYSPLHQQPDANDGKVANAAAKVADVATDVAAEDPATDKDDDERDGKS